MASLSKKDLGALARRGIDVQYETLGTIITFTSSGMAWLFNYLSTADSLGSTLTLSLLKKVAVFHPDRASWRELRFKAVPLPVRKTSYVLLLFYLEGSPPKALQVFPPDTNTISNSVNVPWTEGGAFKIRNNQMVSVEFTKAEVKELKNGVVVSAKVDK